MKWDVESVSHRLLYTQTGVSKIAPCWPFKRMYSRKVQTWFEPFLTRSDTRCDFSWIGLALKAWIFENLTNKSSQEIPRATLYNQQLLITSKNTTATFFLNEILRGTKKEKCIIFSDFSDFVLLGSSKEHLKCVKNLSFSCGNTHTHIIHETSDGARGCISVLACAQMCTAMDVSERAYFYSQPQDFKLSWGSSKTHFRIFVCFPNSLL